MIGARIAGTNPTLSANSNYSNPNDLYGSADVTVAVAVATTGIGGTWVGFPPVIARDVAPLSTTLNGNSPNLQVCARDIDGNLRTG